MSEKHPPVWEYNGVFVTAWTKGEARARFKQILASELGLKTVQRLPVGAVVRRCGREG